MPTPSLLIVPARFKSGKMYSQIPTSGAGDFTVTRATAATRVNASGFIQSVASGIPRLDYFASGGTAGCPALLVEPAATNTFIESETLFTTHLPQNLTTSGYTNATASPDGNVTAEKFVPNTTNGVHGIANGSFLAITSGTTYTLSLFVKSDGGPYNLISLTFDSATAWGATRNCIFNASNGTNFSVPSGATMTSENYGNGWYRIRATLTAVGNFAATQYQYRIYVTDASGNLSWMAPSGNTNGIFCWGAQLETGSVATSYIPTTTAAVTRNADVVSVSGAVSGSIGQASGTIYIECQSEFATNDIIVINTAGQSPGNNYVSITKTATNVFRLSLIASGTTILIDQTSAITSFAKIAVAYASGNTAFFINGTQIGSTDTTGFSFNAALNNITFISNMVSGTKTTRIRAVALYTTRLSNAELAALTTP